MAVGEGPLESRRRSGASGAVLSSVGNAARVLKEFGNGVDELGITELSRRIGIGKSTAHRIVSTLVEEKLLERTAGSGRYHLAVSMFDLGAAVPIRRQLYEASHSVLDALRARSHTAALIAVRSGRETYFLARAESDEAVALLRPVGNRVWVHASASGRALLAELPEFELDELLAGWQLPAVTRYTITDHALLRAELARIRSQGYAYVIGETDEDVNAVAAVVRSPGGLPIASVSVTMPSPVDPATLRALARLAVSGAAAVSARLAGTPPRPPSQ